VTVSTPAAASTVPGANSFSVDFLRPYQGYGDILIVERCAAPTRSSWAWPLR